MKKLMNKKMFQVLLFASMVCFVVSCTGSNGSDHNPVQDLNRMQDLIDQATHIVRTDYPSTFLYEASGEVRDGQGFSASDVTRWEFVYRNDDPINTTVILEQNNDVFGKPQLIGDPWLEDVLIDQPLVRDLDQAINLLHNAGHNTRFNGVVVRKPLYPGIEETFYIFTLPEEGTYVFVGDHTGTVTTQD